MVGLVSSALSPISAAYLLVLICICKDANVFVVLFWMGIGAAAMAAYGKSKYFLGFVYAT